LPEDFLRDPPAKSFLSSEPSSKNHSSLRGSFPELPTITLQNGKHLIEMSFDDRQGCHMRAGVCRPSIQLKTALEEIRDANSACGPRTQVMTWLEFRSDGRDASCELFRD
jgi:hypothetical protein